MKKKMVKKNEITMLPTIIELFIPTFERGHLKFNF